MNMNELGYYEDTQVHKWQLLKPLGTSAALWERGGGGGRERRTEFELCQEENSCKRATLILFTSKIDLYCSTHLYRTRQWKLVH